jgi:glutathione reductase (NADPH)
MKRKFDLIVIGTGSAASTIASQCRSAGWEVAIIDSRPFGGTCALRGCDPKKVLVGASEVVDWVRRMKGRGVRTDDARIDWAELMRFKRSFTDPVPKSRQHGFAKAGIRAFHGWAHFVDSAAVEVGGEVLEGGHVVIATGAKPRKLGIPGERHVTTSDRFLELEELPRRIIFIGGGYISFEFAHIAALAGSEVTILHRGERPLEGFDPDLVAKLVEKTKHMGAVVKLRMQVEQIEEIRDCLTVHASSPDGPKEAFHTDLVVHGAGRVPEIDDLNLAASGVQAEERGVVVNEYLQSVSNPAIYVAGDAALTGLPPLTPVAAYQGRIVASNLLKGNHRKCGAIPIPSVVFTVPALSAVGLSERAAQQKGLRFRISREETSGWYSSRRVGEDYSAFKILVDQGTDRIIGAHLLGPSAEEVINIIAMAMQADVPATRVRHVLYGYPTLGSDLQYML